MRVVHPSNQVGTPLSWNTPNGGGMYTPIGWLHLKGFVYSADADADFVYSADSV